MAATRGRAVYLNQCVACHSPEPVYDHTLADWQIIIPDMAAEAELTEQEEADLRAYIRAAYHFGPAPPPR